MLPLPPDSPLTWAAPHQQCPCLPRPLQGQELVRSCLLLMCGPWVNYYCSISHVHVAPPTAPPTSGSATDVNSYQPTSGASSLPPPHPWQQAPPAAPPQGIASGWQQPMMYGNVPAPLPMGGAAPPLPPGVPGAPPPPPPEQNWVREIVIIFVYSPYM